MLPFPNGIDRIGLIVTTEHDRYSQPLLALAPNHAEPDQTLFSDIPQSQGPPVVSQA